MTYNPQKHHRRSVRLKNHDYAAGAYFVTVCAHNKACIFGSIDLNATVYLNSFGQSVQREWQRLALIRPNIEMDAFVVMPNHVHGIIHLIDNKPALVGARRASSALHHNGHPNGVEVGSLGAIIGGFKSAVTREINNAYQRPGIKIWQRSFHDVVIRDELMLNTLRQYIESNPARWVNDRYYVEGA